MESVGERPKTIRVRLKNMTEKIFSVANFDEGKIDGDDWYKLVEDKLAESIRRGRQSRFVVGGMSVPNYYIEIVEQGPYTMIFNEAAKPTVPTVTPASEVVVLEDGNPPVKLIKTHLGDEKKWLTSRHTSEPGHPNSLGFSFVQLRASALFDPAFGFWDRKFPDVNGVTKAMEKLKSQDPSMH